MSQQSRLLAIDASVLRSAGGREQGQSAHCSKVLSEVLRIGHRAALCPTTSQEWTKHASGFSKKWRSSMIARKRMIKVDTQLTQARLRREVEALSDLSPNQRAALEKDIHMLALAMGADKILLTGDSALKDLTLQSNITPVLEWLLTLPLDSAPERSALIERLHELAKNKPHPPLPT